MTTEEFEKKVIPLSEKLYPMVARMLGDKIAEDAVQEIMIKLWNNRGNIHNHPNIPGFVFLTARNYCLDLLKKKRIHVSSYSELYGLQILGKNHDQTEWKELNTLVMGILKGLPKQQAEIMMLRDIDGFDHKEIAAMTNLKIEHVRVLLSRARKKVRVQLKNIYRYEQ